MGVPLFHPQQLCDGGSRQHFLSFPTKREIDAYLGAKPSHFDHDNHIRDMNEALCSILTEEDEWCFDAEGRSIKFNKDGTGEVCTLGPVASHLR